MFNADRAVYFFVGNIAAHPRMFMLLGLFYPDLKVVDFVQDGLFSAPAIATLGPPREHPNALSAYSPRAIHLRVSHANAAGRYPEQ